MPNDFVIYFSGNATFDQITAVDRALQKIGPGPIEQDMDNLCFYATLSGAPRARTSAT